jgi:hypothetical protein
MINIHSETWQAIASHVTGRIAKLARDLEAPGRERPDIEYANAQYARGQIKALREVLALGDPKRPDSRSQP